MGVHSENREAGKLSASRSAMDDNRLHILNPMMFRYILVPPRHCCYMSRPVFLVVASFLSESKI